jgi:hypothetical protein
MNFFNLKIEFFSSVLFFEIISNDTLQKIFIESESAEPPDEGNEPPDVLFPGEFKCPVLLFKPRFAGQSKVYSALDNSSGHRVAIKQIKVNCQSDNRSVVSLIRELR